MDGGGSGCRALVQNSSGRTVQATAGPANFTSDPSGAILNIVAVVRGALSTAGLVSQASGVQAHLGIAGVLDSADGWNLAARVTAQIPLARCTVSDDRTTHAIGVLGGQDGYAIAIGTGSTIARVQDATVIGAGGWGLTLGDEASGAWLGRQALALTLHAQDRLQDHSDLTRALLSDHGGAAGIVRFARAADAADFAALAPKVVAAAGSGDAHGESLLAEGAAYLCQALRALGFSAGDRLCATGGLGPTYAPRIAQALGATVSPRLGDALSGGLVLAERTVS